MLTRPQELMELATTDMGPPRVLLAEDDEAMRALLAEALAERGYEVLEARNGLELLDALHDMLEDEEGIDLVLSDIRMPACSGLHALERLREQDWATPILFMTAFGSRSTHSEAQRLGAAVIDKPFDLDELLERVALLVPPTRYQEGWR